MLYRAWVDGTVLQFGQSSLAAAQRKGRVSIVRGVDVVFLPRVTKEQAIEALCANEKFARRCSTCGSLLGGKL